MSPSRNMFWIRWVFLRILGLGFVTGFYSLATQIHGLIGPEGILPASDYLEAVAQNVPFWQRPLLAPSLLWMDSGSTGLNVLVWGGFGFGILLLFNIWPRVTLFLCWLFYLSFMSVARNFSGFQFDGLVLETAFVALFWAPPGVWPGLGRHASPPRWATFMLWWLLFRLSFESGLVKLLSGDVSWRGLTALEDYYENCPFPTWLGYFAQQLPAAAHKAMAVYTFVAELVMPILIFCGRRARLVAFGIWTAFQIGIALTANYAYFNVLSFALGLTLLDDSLFGAAASPPQPAAGWKKWGARLVLGAHFYLTLALLLVMLRAPLPEAALRPVAWTAGFRTANRYGLFAVMTHERPQIEFEGSNDGGRTWKTYKFKWQPQETDRPPRFMAPHLARFDWNLWFAVLGPYQRNRFVLDAARKLIEGERVVIELFRENPFEGDPPDVIRFPLYKYAFTDLKTWKKTGNYWTREPAGYYAPVVARHPVTGEWALLKN